METASLSLIWTHCRGFGPAGGTATGVRGALAAASGTRRDAHGIIRSTVNPSEPVPAPAAKNEDEPMLYCPVCSCRLTELKCKLVCDRCGYYMSCADYY